MRQGNWSRPISSPGFFFRRKIDWMKKKTLIMLVMLCLSQLYCNGWKKDDCIDSITFQNNFNASIQNDFPKTFTSGFVVQPTTYGSRF